LIEINPCGARKKTEFYEFFSKKRPATDIFSYSLKAFATITQAGD
jgi:hypothetical protein